MTHRLVLSCIWLCMGSIPRVVVQLHGREGYCYRKQLPLQLFISLNNADIMHRVLWFCTAGQMHPFFQLKSSRNSRLQPRFLRRVILSRSVYSTSPGEELLFPKITGLSRTLLSMPVLPKLITTESMKASDSTRPQQVCFHVVWRNTVAACELQ